MYYTIKLDGGKYTIIHDNGHLDFLRHSMPWTAANDLKDTGVVLAMAQRIEELEVAIKVALDGTLDARGVRQPDGIASRSMAGHIHLRIWEERLRNVLEQKQ